MSNTLPVAERELPLPPHVAWFSPWRAWCAMPPWRRYPLAAIVLLTAYIAAPMPLVYLLRVTGVIRIPLVLAVCQTVFAPLEICYANVEAVAWFYDMQRDLLERVFVQLP